STTKCGPSTNTPITTANPAAISTPPAATSFTRPIPSCRSTHTTSQRISTAVFIASAIHTPAIAATSQHHSRRNTPSAPPIPTTRPLAIRCTQAFRCDPTRYTIPAIAHHTLRPRPITNVRIATSLLHSTTSPAPLHHYNSLQNSIHPPSPVVPFS